MTINLPNLIMFKRNQKTKAFLISLSTSFALSLIATSASSQAVFNSTFSATPPSTERIDPPSLMLSMSRDHQYHFKAYNDYTDLDESVVDENGNIVDVDQDGNPIVETTYKHTFSYFGYFDSTKCYEYDVANERFNPTNIVDVDFFVTGRDPITGADIIDENRVVDRGVCAGNLWHGNFLNWMSMTRMDIVRRTFFGGLRSEDPTDPNAPTVLERAYLPSDAHSFTKYYNGNGGATINEVTPFNDPGDANNNGRDDIDEGYTFCNTSIAAAGDFRGAVASQDAQQAPEIRAVQGNWQLWGANERWQCSWLGEEPNVARDGGNFNTAGSGIFAHDNDPDENADGGQTFIARVSVCVDGLIGDEANFCEIYPNGNVKPIGILQRYGDDGLINFGLMSGAYDSNTEGGVLRKNTGPLDDEIDVGNTGIFTFTETSDSIIKFLSLLRPWGYRLSNGTYIGGGESDDCSFQLTDIPDGRCNNWGNPISEIYAETVRYLAGLNPNPVFAADDTAFLDGLNDTAWVDPLSIDENLCSDLNTIVINASVSSYDDDNSALTDVDGGINGTTIPTFGNITDIWTDTVGVAEGINGNNFFVGIGSADNNEFCTSKRVDALSDAMGLCPEAPTVNGSFAMAGIAHYAHNNDVRPDLPGNQTVNTFAVEFATNQPIISVPRTDSDEVLEIIPAYRLLRGDQGGGALVDFRIVQPHTRIGSTNTFEAFYYVNWDDSEQGGDFDQDVWGSIYYFLNEDTDQITITTDVVAESTANPQLFGFVVNGTSQDGFHAYSGIEGANFIDPTGVRGCNNCRANSEFGGGQRGPQSAIFDLQASITSSLESPLYYAAKYGGFTESLNDGEDLTINDLPDEIAEFDNINNNTGQAGSDGLPDNFFSVNNPGQLFASLDLALQKTLAQNRRASSSVSTLTNANGFENIIVQSAFQESDIDDLNNEVVWTGELFSYFIDQFGIFRQDGDGDGVLSDGNGSLAQSYIDDPAFRFENDDRGIMIQPLGVFIGTDGILDETSITGRLIDVSELNTVWDASERLRDLDNETIVNQRVYDETIPESGIPADSAGGTRYIFTYIDENNNGVVDAAEQRSFVNGDEFGVNSGLINTNTVSYFGVTNQNEARNIVDFIRGFEASNQNIEGYDPSLNFRNRTLQVEKNGTSEFQTFRLGDLVNSIPLVVAEPSERYDVDLDDQTYAAFAEVYANRRQVTYVGANDGLLHAFNAGFSLADLGIDGFFEEVPPSPNDFFVAPGNSSPVGHPLGSEIWAYAPFNLLPHLQFLTLPNYDHQFYVDGSPKSFDVKIFEGEPDNCDFDIQEDSIQSLNTDCRYINGWGTILVVGMRQGGGDFPLSDSLGNPLVGSDGEPVVARSSYVILDITNPELEPKVLAEVNHPDLNFTTSDFDVFYDCENNCQLNTNPVTGNASVDSDEIFDGSWKLIFGSGPNDVRAFTTTETAKVFSVNLEDVISSQGSQPLSSIIEVEEVPNSDNSFVGGITAQDWDNGDLGFRNDDVAYFGTVQATADPATGISTGSESGSVFRYFPGEVPTGVFDRVNLLIDIDRPVFQTPIALSRDTLTNNVLASWVYIGTGIFLTRENADITEEEHFLGVIEPVDQGDLNDLAVNPIDPGRENSELLIYDEVDVNELHDVTDIVVLTADESTSGIAGELLLPEVVFGVTVNTIEELAQEIVGQTQGWIRSLPNSVNAAQANPSARIAGAVVASNNQLFFSTFTPENQDGFNVCNAETGTSNIFGLNQSTGTASTIGTFGDDGVAFDFMSESIDRNIGSPLIVSSNFEGLNAESGVIITQREENPQGDDGDGGDNDGDGGDNNSEADTEPLCFPIKTKDNDFVTICL